MKLVVGLGNPGAKYAQNRHNIGFMAVDRIASDHGFSPWRPRFLGEVSDGRLDGCRVTLLKPGTFMNLSGQSVGEAMRYLKITPGDVIVLHDELDLVPGKLRMKTGGGHAGHNGLRSLHQHIGDSYRRLRIGIGHPGHKDRVAHYVLSDFAKSEQTLVDDLLRGISDGAAALVAGDDARFGNAVAARINPPRNSGTARPGTKTSGPAEKQPAAAAVPPSEIAAPQSISDKLRALAHRFR